MPKDYTQEAPTFVRRSDRAVSDETWLKYFLHTAAVGTLATVYEGQPFMNTNLFVYDEAAHCIYTHTARTGRTRTNVDLHEKVCFTIMTMGRLLPDKEALEFSVEYAGVMVFGTASLIEDETEGLAVLQLLMDKYAPHLAPERDYRPPIKDELARTAVYKISISEWSAKKKEVEDFAGAYWFDEPAILQSVRQRHLWHGEVDAIQVSPLRGQMTQALDEVEAVVGKGLVGDHRFGLPPTHDDEAEEVTLIASEDLAAVNAKYDLPISHEQSRRNILTSGVPLNYLVGKRFRIGEVVLEGQQLCEPCSTLAERTGYGKPIISAMLHRAGLRTIIIKGGMIRTGDSVLPLD